MIESSLMHPWSRRTMIQKIAACALAALALLAAHPGPLPGSERTIEINPFSSTSPSMKASWIRLRGNTRPEARAEYDRGRVEDSLPLDHMLLQLKRGPELEQELDQYIDGLTDKTSPNFRQWLTAAQQAEIYGPAQQDLDTITNWLQLPRVHRRLHLPQSNGHRLFRHGG